MKRHLWWMPCVAVAAGLTGVSANAQLNTIVFSENFDSLAGTLGDSVNERQGFPIVTELATDTDSEPIANAFSSTGPAGWVVNNNLGSYQGSPTLGNAGVPGQGVADYGVDEWQGWNFASKDFWSEAAGDQDRSLFTNATGTIAVVDPDEYFDLGPTDGSTGGPSNPVNGGFYNSGLSTPGISVAPGTLYTLSFDSSWRPESLDDGHPNNDGTLLDGDNNPIPDSDNDPLTSFVDLNNQAVEVVAVFDNGVRQTRTAWDSLGPANPGDPIPASFKDDTPNERIDNLNFGVPAGATSVKFEFNIANAGNDWWWAIDNLAVNELVGGAEVWTEDFEGVALGDSVNERRSLVADKVTAANDDAETFVRPDSFTKDAPAGWNVDNSDTPADTLGDNNVGVFEWEGWSFATEDFWTFADGSGRGDFDNASGVFAIADGDEWDDLGDPTDLGELNTLLETPAIDIPAIADGSRFAIKFDSSWRDEDDQAAILTVSLDGGSPTEILRWESQQTLDPNNTPGDPSDDVPNPFFHDDNTNEMVLLEIDTAGASTAQFAFRYIGTNDWWWAVDNIQVGIIPEPSTGLLLVLGGLLPFLNGRRG
ncbi:hypothetical protein MalM25_07200 [Planctomycetes bacterium MalM25]|nr:hypothetical protein MalM25_07200 [Planctomycetes bacterium MalM25]